MIDPRETVANVVLDHSECAPVFQKHRIDFCCRGDVSVDTAAREKNVDTAALVAELERAVAQRRAGGEHDPRALPTAALVERIVTKHHHYLRQALPFVQGLAAKVARVHGDKNPRLRELSETVQALKDALEPHLDSEEETLFPALCSESPDKSVVARELAEMHEDHLAVGRLLERARKAAEDYRTPEWACNSYRTLFAELEQLEGDVLTHVHLENHVLMPRFR